MTLLTGVIENIFPEESRGNFRYTNIWLQEQNAQYPNTWQISFFNDEGKWLKGFSTGMLVNVNVAILGKKRVSNGQQTVFTTIRGVKIQKLK